MPTARTMMIAMTFVLLASCKPPKLPDEVNASNAVPPLTEPEAHSAFEATKAAWTSMDANRIKALYAKDIAGFDTAGPLVTDRETWDQNEDTYAAARIDKAKVLGKKIQMLGPDAFVVSFMARVSSTAEPRNDATLRCTDVYRRNAQGQVLIVNEHCSRLTGD